MNWIETPESSSIARFRYIHDDSILEVEFNKGHIYQYFEVPESVFDQMQAASSKGQFLGSSIKGIYRFARA